MQNKPPSLQFIGGGPAQLPTRSIKETLGENAIQTEGEITCKNTGEKYATDSVFALSKTH